MSSRVELIGAGFVELLKSPGVVKDLERRAKAIAAAAGPGNEAGAIRLTGNRARITISTVTREAKVNEATDRSLTRAIDAGR